MARYAQFTAESFAARMQRTSPPASPAIDAGRTPGQGAALRQPPGRTSLADVGGDYGSLLVVRVGRPRKRPVLILDPEEAAADAIRFQQIAAHDFAHPEECARTSAMIRLSAIAANESGLEDDGESPVASALPVDADADAALALWTNPVEPVDTSDWNDGAEAAAMVDAEWSGPVVAPCAPPAPEAETAADAAADNAAEHALAARDDAAADWEAAEPQPGPDVAPAPQPSSGCEEATDWAEVPARGGLLHRIGRGLAERLRAFLAAF